MNLDQNEMHGEHTEEKTTGAVQELREFAETTTLHGVRYATGSNIHRLRRIIWIVFLLAIYGFLIYELRGSLMKFFGYPVSTVVTVNHVQDAAFPAVTICNQNMIKADSLENEDPIVLQVMEARTNEEVVIDWDYFYNYTSDHPPWNLTEIAFRDGHRIEDMLLDCRWQLHTTCTAADFMPRMTDFGVCYTFNADEDNPLIVAHPGSSYGLTFSVDIEQDQYTWSEYGGAGLKVELPLVKLHGFSVAPGLETDVTVRYVKMYVHPQWELPLVKLLGFPVAPGFETDVTVRYVKRKNLRYPYEPFCDQKPLKYSHVYDAALCRHECAVDGLVEVCGCKDFRHPGPAPVCGPQDQIDCILENEEWLGDLRHLNCSCPEPCVREGYETKISIAQWPSNYYRKILSKKLDRTEDYIKDNFLEVNVYLEEVQYEEVNETPTYDGYSLFGDIGGYMGLLCGASVVSLMELADFIFITCFRSRR